MVATYGTQIKSMRVDGKHKTRDSQRWKNVEVQRKRSYAEVAGRSRYQDELDIGTGTREHQGAGGQVQELGIGAGTREQDSRCRTTPGTRCRCRTTAWVLTLTMLLLLKEARCRKGLGRTSRPG